MTNNEEVQIEYLNRTETIKKCSSYQELISLLEEKFFLTKEMLDQMELYYLDEDLDENLVNDGENFSECFENKLILRIQETETNTQGKEAINFDKLAEIINNQKEKLSQQINDYKKNLLELSNKVLAEKLKEIDIKHEEEITKIEEYYNECLEKVKQKTEEKIKIILEKIQNKWGDILNDKLSLYDEEIKKLIDDEFDRIVQQCENKINKINFEKLEGMQNTASNILDESKADLQKLEKI